MKTYTIEISEEQRRILERAMMRLADDVNASKVFGMNASDPTTGMGDCLGEEIEALRDMLSPESMQTDAINGFTS